MNINQKKSNQNDSLFPLSKEVNFSNNQFGGNFSLQFLFLTGSCSHFSYEYHMEMVWFNQGRQIHTHIGTLTVRFKVCQINYNNLLHMGCLFSVNIELADKNQKDFGINAKNSRWPDVSSPAESLSKAMTTQCYTVVTEAVMWKDVPLFSLSHSLINYLFSLLCFQSLVVDQPTTL